MALVAALLPGGAFAQGTAFTYQGRLSDSSRPANGSYDLAFSLFPAASGGTRVGAVLSFPATPVTNGLFSLSLDFGQGSFNGQDRWIELAVRTNGAASFSTLAPRRKVLASPQSQFAASAASVPASGISGVLALANLPALATSGSALTNLNASALASGAVPDARLSANVALLGAVQAFSASNRFNGPLVATHASNAFSGTFSGNGAALTNLAASALASGAVPDARLSANVPLLGVAQAFTGSNRFNGPLVATHASNALSGAFAGSFSGDGSALVNVNAGALAAGTVPDARLSANVPLLGAVQAFSASNRFNGPLVATHASNAFSGMFSGNGAGLTSLAASALASGTVPDARLSTNVALLNAVQAFTGSNRFNGPLVALHSSNALSGAFAGSFSGDGSALVNVNAGVLAAGTVPDARLSANVPLLNAAQAFSGANRFNGPLVATHASNAFSGTFSGNGAGLASLTASALVGTAPGATNFTGPLSGDVAGTQGATVVASVGGLGASQVASGAARANASTPAFACDVIIRRDPGDGGFVAGPIRAASFTGDGSGLTNLPTSPNMYGAPKGAVIASLVASDPALIGAGYRSLMTIPAPGWTAGATLNAPSARWGQTAVWDGKRMIVWGGWISAGTPTGTGGWYDPGTDAWTTTSSVGAPSGRGDHTAVWTGSQMVVWGGRNGTSNLGSGGRYTPGTGQWAATGTTGAPAGRFGHVAAWTGSRMVVWGGQNLTGYLNDGGVYDPAGNSWTALPTAGAPTGRVNATAVWGVNALYVWGGTDETGETGTGGVLGFSGNTPTGWTALPTLNAPLGRVGHTAVWAGDRMVVWGGSAGGVPLGDGAAYCLGCGDWGALPMANAPLARWGHAAVWTGSEMLVVGGSNAGGEVSGPAGYDPVTKEWRALSGLGGPLARTQPSAAWSGTELLVFGGRASGSAVGTLQRLSPQPEWYLYRKL